MELYFKYVCACGAKSGEDQRVSELQFADALGEEDYRYSVDGNIEVLEIPQSCKDCKAECEE